MMTATPRAVEQTDFDAIAEIYDAVFPPHIVEHYLRRRACYLLHHAAAPGQSALDVGAGTGLLAERLSDLGLGVVALDPFPEVLGSRRLLGLPTLDRERFARRFARGAGFPEPVTRSAG